MKKNGKGNGGVKWSKEEIKKEDKEIKAIRKIFILKGISGNDACEMILKMRHGQTV
ncbi:MAG: hypothetical protein V2A65_08125 [Candidatus Omnitrophota bacterium]